MHAEPTPLHFGRGGVGGQRKALLAQEAGPGCRETPLASARPSSSASTLIHHETGPSHLSSSLCNAVTVRRTMSWNLQELL